MGKKSKRKPNKPSKEQRERGRLVAVLDGFLRGARRIAPTSACRHVPPQDLLRITEEQRTELKVFTARCVLGHIRHFENRASANGSSLNSESSSLEDNDFFKMIRSPACANAELQKGMSQLLLATATDYLLQYGFGLMGNLCRELVCVHLVLLVMISEQKDPSDLKDVNFALLQRGTFTILIAIASRDHYSNTYFFTVKIKVKMHRVFETEYATVKFLNDSIPCNCLGDLKRQLKKEPKLASCHHCQKKVVANELFSCGNCGLGYCSRACQKENRAAHRVECKGAGAILRDDLMDINLFDLRAVEERLLETKAEIEEKKAVRIAPLTRARSATSLSANSNSASFFLAPFRSWSRRRPRRRPRTTLRKPRTTLRRPSTTLRCCAASRGRPRRAVVTMRRTLFKRTEGA